ncbi:nuclear transport factor 2 family protein [Pedobacter antarcticus]|uniref:nuclear transport factor 2 family protein n=1 Tax=Pedobacter antarcticus TaxID=34086 RepID=UPI002930BF71|nr:nuclear transport factor 2 family protein [Pedobacter antarcticus]
MRKVFLFIGLCLLFLNVSAQVDDTTSDLQSIQKTLNLYIVGQSTSDSVMVGQSFHDSWQLKFFRDNEFIVVPKSKYLVGYKKRDTKPDNWSGRIVFIDISHDIAIAKVEISTPSLLFTDYFNLLKINQDWLIVDKVSTRIPHKKVEAPAAKS